MVLDLSIEVEIDLSDEHAVRCARERLEKITNRVVTDKTCNNEEYVSSFLMLSIRPE